MITHENVEQGSADWYGLRLGIPTASNFHKIVTPTGKLSTQADGYLYFLLAEKLLNRPLESLDQTEWMERGQELEPQAVQMYEFENEVKTKSVGFITTDDGLLGASPDRLLIDVNGALEIKCCAPQTHIGFMCDGFGAKYMPQVQGQMLVGDFEFVDRYAYHPEMPPVKERTYRNADYISTLRDALRQFNDRRLELLEKLKSEGYFAEREKIMSVAEQELDTGGHLIYAG